MLSEMVIICELGNYYGLVDVVAWGSLPSPMGLSATQCLLYLAPVACR